MAGGAGVKVGGAPGGAPGGGMGVPCVGPGVAWFSGPGFGVGVFVMGTVGVGAVLLAGTGVWAGFGAGVEGGLMLVAARGFVLSFVTKNENLAPELLGSHSIKLYVGK